MIIFHAGVIGAILQLNNVSPRPVGLQHRGQAVTVWKTGDPIPEFVWEVPDGSPALGAFPATGQTLNHFEVRIFTDGYFQRFGKVVSPTINGNLASWRPTAAEWDEIKTGGAAATLHWVVGGAYRKAGEKAPFGAGKTVTGASNGHYGAYFWSDESTFRVTP